MRRRCIHGRGIAMYLGSAMRDASRPPFSCFSSCKEALAVKSLSNYQTSFSNCIQAWLSLSLINDLKLKPWAKVYVEVEQTQFVLQTYCLLSSQFPNNQFTYRHILCNFILALFMTFSFALEIMGLFS